MSIWASHHVNQQESVGFQIGPLRIWIQRSENEWLIGRAYQAQYVGIDERVSQIDDAPDSDVEFQRWVAEKNDYCVSLQAALADRPMVARTLTPLHVPIAHQAQVFLQLPLWVRIAMGSGAQQRTLCEIPTVENSNTWFGDPVSGELCYSLQTVAKSVGDSVIDAHRAIAMVTISNESQGEQLKFERICLRAPLLALYQSSQYFCTNHVRMIFRGSNYPDDIRYVDDKPESAETCTLIAEPRQSGKQNLLRSGFSEFKAWVYG